MQAWALMEENQEIDGCTLSKSDVVDRRAAWKDVEHALVDRVRTDEGFRVRFRRDREVPESLRALVDAEADCCGWASWVLADEGDHSVLEVTGPPGRIGSLARAFGL